MRHGIRELAVERVVAEVDSAEVRAEADVLWDGAGEAVATEVEGLLRLCSPPMPVGTGQERRLPDKLSARRHESSQSAAVKSGAPEI